MDKRKKKSKKKRTWDREALLIPPLTLFVVGLFCFKSSLPFRVEEIRPSRGFSFQAAHTASQTELDRIKTAFAQPFYFVNETDQCYLFVSKKEDYLLKFFKIRKLTPKYWLNYVPFPWLEKERLNKIGHRERARQELLGNFKTAFSSFRHQTGLLFLHLFGTNCLKSKVHLIDQQNTSHYVDLDTVPFVLEKSSVPVFTHVKKLIEEQKKKEALSCLLLVLDLVREQCQRGFVEVEEDLDKSYGFIGNRVVFVGVEHLVKDDTIQGKLSTLREVFKVSRKLSEWLEANYPSLVPEFQRESQDLISLLEEV